ncbi:MAG: ABC transporter permease [Parachlamydiaceae bacterium]|nr:ABC transporter permease [Parachlamydiaceae bacterium]
MFNSGSFRRIKAMMIKEFYQIIRDPSSILIGIAMPLMLLFLYGYGLSLDIDHLPIGLVLEDTSPDAQSFANALTHSRYFSVKVVRDRRELVDGITSGQIRGFVVIPAYFSAFRQKPSTLAPIQVIADGSEPNTANFVQNYVQGVWTTWLAEESISDNLQGLPQITLVPRFWYNEELESRNFLIPGSLALIMTLIGTLLTALVVAREWERGTMEALMSTPITTTELILGKIIPYFVFAMLSMALCTAIAVLFYHVPFRGSWMILALTTGIFLISALGLGLWISTVTRNQFAAAQAAQVAAFLPAFILSGFIFETSSMPWLIRMISALLPARYFVSSLQTLFLVGNVWSLLLTNMLVMALMGMFFIAITASITVKRLD